MFEFPFTSVTIHVTDVLPAGKIAGALLMTDKMPQLSAVMGVPGFIPLTEHCPVAVFTAMLEGQLMVGASLSVTVTKKLQLATLQALVAVTSTLVLPDENAVPECCE